MAIELTQDVVAKMVSDIKKAGDVSPEQAVVTISTAIDHLALVNPDVANVRHLIPKDIPQVTQNLVVAAAITQTPISDSTALRSALVSIVPPSEVEGIISAIPKNINEIAGAANSLLEISQNAASIISKQAALAGQPEAAGEIFTAFRVSLPYLTSPKKDLGGRTANTPFTEVAKQLGLNLSPAAKLGAQNIQLQNIYDFASGKIDVQRMFAFKGSPQLAGLFQGFQNQSQPNTIYPSSPSQLTPRSFFQNTFSRAQIFLKSINPPAWLLPTSFGFLGGAVAGPAGLAAGAIGGVAVTKIINPKTRVVTELAHLSTRVLNTGFEFGKNFVLKSAASFLGVSAVAGLALVLLTTIVFFIIQWGGLVVPPNQKSANLSEPVGTTVGVCDVATSGYCSPTNFVAIFGQQADNASRICNGESIGGRPAIINDGCLRNPQYQKRIHTWDYSVGLFQINMLSHPNPAFFRTAAGLSLAKKIAETGNAGKTCYNAFDPATIKTPSSLWSSSYCTVVDQNLLSVCVSWFQEPENNMAYAGFMSNGGQSWNPWSVARSCSIVK